MNTCIYRALFFIFLSLVGKSFGQPIEFSQEPILASEPAFEKVYFCAAQIVSFPDGIYYKERGELKKIRTVLHDEQGMYTLSIQHQCPLCGRYWAKGEVPEEYSCPIYKKRFLRTVWLD